MHRTIMNYNKYAFVINCLCRKYTILYNKENVIINKRVEHEVHKFLKFSLVY